MNNNPKGHLIDQDLVDALCSVFTEQCYVNRVLHLCITSSKPWLIIQ